MSEESTQTPIQEPSEESEENLAEAAKLSAEAEVLKAKAELAKAKAPLIDRLILRGLVPIALALVGPWAAWTFSHEAQAAKEKATEVQENVSELQTLLKSAKADAAKRRTRFQQIEEAKAVELAAMSAMVTRLDETLKYSLIQMAVAQALARVEIGEEPGVSPMMPEPFEPASDIPSREGVVRDVAEQIQLPGVDDAEIQRIASESYDKVLRTKRR